MPSSRADSIQVSINGRRAQASSTAFGQTAVMSIEPTAAASRPERRTRLVRRSAGSGLSEAATRRLLGLARELSFPGTAVWQLAQLGDGLSAAGRPIAQRGQVLDHLVQRHLAEGLDRFDHRDFEMQFLVRRPFHSAFGCGKLIDQLEQSIGLDQCRLLA